MSYDYKVLEVVRVVDGDTVDLRLDLGFRIHTVNRFRLFLVDTPERGQPQWSEASDFTRLWLSKPGELRALTHKSDSFGRWLADLYYTSDPENTLSRALVIVGLGVWST